MALKKPPQIGDIIHRSTIPRSIEWKIVAINTISIIDMENRDNGGYIHKTENYAYVMKEYDYVLLPTSNFLYYPNNPFLGNNSTNDLLSSVPGNENNPFLRVCDHNWKIYIGLNFSDEYCTKCNKIRDIVE